MFVLPSHQNTNWTRYTRLSTGMCLFWDKTLFPPPLLHTEKWHMSLNVILQWHSMWCLRHESVCQSNLNRRKVWREPSIVLLTTSFQHGLFVPLICVCVSWLVLLCCLNMNGWVWFECPLPISSLFVWTDVDCSWFLFGCVLSGVVWCPLHMDESGETGMMCVKHWTLNMVIPLAHHTPHLLILLFPLIHNVLMNNNIGHTSHNNLKCMISPSRDQTLGM